jgi:hypothetical protein
MKTTYQNKLATLQKEVTDKIKALIIKKGKESKHKYEQVLRVKAGQQFNLDGGRYLVEISDVELIDNDGHTYAHDVLPLEKLCEIVDSFL